MCIVADYETHINKTTLADIKDTAHAWRRPSGSIPNAA